MAKYVASRVLAEAVRRLSESRAGPGFVDFLIIKRAMKIDGSSRVTLSKNDSSLVGAINELMAFGPATKESQTDRLINVFGSGRAANRGYRTKKYYSNGTAVTVPRWTDIFRIAGQSAGARQVEFAADYEQRLAGRLLVDVGDGKPKLQDTASWYFRSTELVTRFGAEPSFTDLIAGLVADLGLQTPELAALFYPEGPGAS